MCAYRVVSALKKGCADENQKHPSVFENYKWLLANYSYLVSSYGSLYLRI